MMDWVSRVLIAAILAAVAGTAVAQSPAEHAAAYRECPVGGVAFWMGAPRALPPPADDPDLIIIDPDSMAIGVRWAGDDDWIAPRPVPDDVLLAAETWSRPPSMVGQHTVIRRLAGVDLPEGDPRILLIERTEHWAWHWESTVAVRRPDGLWLVDYVQRYDDGTIRQERRDLSVKASRRMDELVDDHCLVREPFHSEFAHIISSDNTRWTLEVETGDRATRVAGRDSGYGRAGAITYLLRGGSAL